LEFHASCCSLSSPSAPSHLFRESCFPSEDRMQKESLAQSSCREYSSPFLPPDSWNIYLSILLITKHIGPIQSHHWAFVPLASFTGCGAWVLRIHHTPP
jgi:hypothetical protein